MYVLGNIKSLEFIYWYLWLGKIYGCYFEMIIFYIRFVNDVVFKIKKINRLYGVIEICLKYLSIYYYLFFVYYGIYNSFEIYFEGRYFCVFVF